MKILGIVAIIVAVAVVLGVPTLAIVKRIKYCKNLYGSDWKKHF